MTSWSELSTRQRPSGLPPATRREQPGGVARYVFDHHGQTVDDPSVDPVARQTVSPREYGFSIRGYDGGRTAWARDFANGTMLVVNVEGVSHVLASSGPARVLFVGVDGAVLQDTGNPRKPTHRVPDLVTIRLTVSATFDLYGESPETARALLMGMVDRAVLQGVPPHESDAVVVGHSFDASGVLANEGPRSSDTNFSQLLDL